MRTIVTLADFYRDRPLVLASEEETFFLVFHTDGGNDVELVPRWRRIGSSFDGLVVKVEVMNPDSHDPSEEVEWTLTIHEDSPTGLRMNDLDDEESSDLEESDFKPGEVIEDYVSAGDVVCLEPKNVHMKRAYRLMFSVDVPTDPEPPSPPTDPLSPTRKISNIQQLPEELLRKIVAKLPYSYIANNVCFVSRKMFATAKSISDWPVLNMHGCRSLDEVNALACRAHQTCVTLRAPCHNVWGVEFKPLVDFRWPALKHLAISSSLGNSDLNIRRLSEAMRTDRFPRLVTLEAYQRKTNNRALGIEVINRWTHRGLKELTIRLDYRSYRTSALEAHQWERGSVFAGFPNLELLHVVVKGSGLHGCYGANSIFSQAFAAGHLSKLRELRIECDKTVDQWDPEHDAQLDSAPPTAVERLSIECPRYLVQHDTFHRLHAGVFFKRFPNLMTLQLSDEIQLTHWESVPASSLKELKELRMGDAGIDEVPFALMTSLQAVWIHKITVGEAPHPKLPPELLLHPKLTVLRLKGVNGLKCLAPSLSALTQKTSNIRFLELVCRVEWQSVADLELLSECLAALPTLGRISFFVDYNGSATFYPGILACILGRGSCLEQVQIKATCYPDPESLDRLMELTEEMVSLLPGHWTWSRGPGPDESYLAATVNISKTGGGESANDLYRLDRNPFLFPIGGPLSD